MKVRVSLRLIGPEQAPGDDVRRVVYAEEMRGEEPIIGNLWVNRNQFASNPPDFIAIDVTIPESAEEEIAAAAYSG